MKYSKENFMSVLNQVKNVCIRENQNIILRSLLSEEFNEDTIKVIKNSINENNLNTIDEIVKLTRIVESITHSDVTDIIHKITNLFMNYNPKDPNAAYNIANELLKYSNDAEVA